VISTAAMAPPDMAAKLAVVTAAALFPVRDPVSLVTALATVLRVFCDAQGSGMTDLNNFGTYRASENI